MHLSYHAALTRKDAQGISEQDRLLALVRRGDEESRRELRPKRFPSQVSYLKDWSYQVFGGMARSADGSIPSIHQSIYYWAQLHGERLRPHEVDALARCVSVLANPPALESLQ